MPSADVEEGSNSGESQAAHNPLSCGPGPLSAGPGHGPGLCEPLEGAWPGVPGSGPEPETLEAQPGLV